jgi:hypothetical protein
MDDQAKLVSKVLVLDSDLGCYERLKVFCEANDLSGLTVQPENAMSVLRSNVDLGAILLSEHYDGKEHGGLLMARKIHVLRPELPIFLRRVKEGSLDDFSAEDRMALSAAFTIEKIDELRPILDEFIFSLSYPNAFVRGITEMSKAALESQFKGLDVDIATPYIVRDRLIYGEIFTLIPLETGWCRGYMMLQTEEIALLSLVKANKTHMRPDEAFDFRNLNGVLGEITNLIWGAFKNRYVAYGHQATAASQVPIVINHLHRYISFGSDNPQLCFKYTLTDKNSADTTPLVLYQKFVFNLSWSPKDFMENQTSVEDLVSSGELDLF